MTYDEILDAAKKAHDLRKDAAGKRRNVTEMKTTIEAKLGEIFDRTGLNAFFWAGYTPYFNDGDPCNHSGYCGFSIARVGSAGYYYLDTYEMPKELGGKGDGTVDDFVEDLADPAAAFVKVAPVETPAEWKAELDMISEYYLQDLFEAAFETNYLATVIRKDGEFKWYEEDWSEHD